MVGANGGPRGGGDVARQPDHRCALLAARKGPGDACDCDPRRTGPFGLYRSRRADIAAIRLCALQGRPALDPSDNHVAPGAAPCRARRGICLCRAVRGGDAVLRRRKRGTHGGDDRGAQQCRAQARRTRRELPPPAAGGNHQRDHRALRRQHIGRVLGQS